jgi:putative ABC transport system permease protein
MIVSEELARRVWSSRSAIGECLRIDRADAACHTVVGVAENAHRFEIVEEVEPVFYVPLEQRPDWTPTTTGARAVVVRVAGETKPVVSRLRSALGDGARSLRDQRVIALSDLLSRQYEPWELGARLFAGLAVLAVALALLGLYGVLNSLVTLRERELGIRIALGAKRTAVVALVLREVVRYVAFGAAAGIGLSLLLAGRVGALLYRVSPHDPAVLMATLLALGVGVVAAAVVPARRAMRVDPMTAIRDE